MEDKKISEYINKQKSPQKEISKKARKISFKALPGCQEEMKWGAATFQGGKFYIAALKNSVNIGFAIGGLNKKEIGQFAGGGKTMRHIKIKKLSDIDEKKLIKLIKLVNKKAVCSGC